MSTKLILSSIITVVEQLIILPLVRVVRVMHLPIIEDILGLVNSNYLDLFAVIRLSLFIVVHGLLYVLILLISLWNVVFILGWQGSLDS